MLLTIFLFVFNICSQSVKMVAVCHMRLLRLEKWLVQIEIRCKNKICNRFQRLSGKQTYLQLWQTKNGKTLIDKAFILTID